MKSITLIFILIASFVTAQEDSLLVPSTMNSGTLKIVIRTEEKINEAFIAFDNLTAKLTEDSCVVFYMNYGDGIVSSMTIPYSVLSDFRNFEQKVAALKCKETDCKHFILFEIGETKKRYPIDILDHESVSNLMLELEG